MWVSLNLDPSYSSGLDRIAALLEWRKTNVGNAERAKARANADKVRLAERERPWPDPVPDIAQLLDEIVAEIARYVVAPFPMLHAVALWIVFAHALQ